MTRIEDDLAAMAREVRSGAAEVDVDAALAGVALTRPPRRPWLLGVAAAVVLVALVAGGVALLSDRGDSHIVADGGPTSAPPTAPTTSTAPAREVTFDLLVEGATSVPVGTLSYAAVADAFTDQWGMAGFDGVPPEVDFDRWVVVSFTRMAACGEQLVAFVEDGGWYEPVFDDSQRPDECAESRSARTYGVALDRARLPDRFKMQVDIGGGHPPQRLEVQPTSASAVRLPTDRSGPPPVQGPDLALPEPGREITFDRIGEVALGQRVSSAEVLIEENPPCGYWPRGRRGSSHDDPQQTPTGLVDASGGTPVLSAVYLRRNTTYRTASGVGVGTTLATLERIYGDELVVDDPDPDATPTDGLIAYYRRVAGVRRGDHALAFYLRDDVVEAVKLSGVDVWGDDEGCA